MPGKHTPRIRPGESEAPLNWHMLGPGEPALSEWAELGLVLPDMDTVREWRLRRVREKLAEFDYAGIVLFDPLNIRYAVGATNMMIWTTHNPARYVFIATDGPVTVFEFSRACHLSDPFPLIDEVRPATAYDYFAAGNRFDEMANRWAAEIASLVKEHGRGNPRLAIDRSNPEGTHYLEARGVTLENGEELMEKARSIKHPEEIKAMRCAMAATEKAIALMHDAFVPGITEQELWSHLHKESIARGGEWIETRLLSSGPRTNPWYQECSSRVINEGDVMGFDTDLVSNYGMCIDISRSWLCGDRTPNSNQLEVYGEATLQIETMLAAIKPGVTLRELTFDSYVPNPDVYRHYTCQVHGVGLCDEWPLVYFPEDWESVGYDGLIEPGMCLTVESYVGRKDGGEGVKLEEQLVVTETGAELLSSYPLDLTRA